MDKILYIGIDGGATKCRAAIAADDGKVFAIGVAGPANPFQDFDTAMRSIVEATRLALADGGLDGDDGVQLVAGVGLAGVNLPAVYAQVKGWQHPFHRMYLTTDLEVACLGAHGGHDGAVVVAGTGSSACSIVAGRHRIFGAYGFPYCDKGSGAWLGLQAVRAVLLQEDGLGPATALHELLVERFGARGNGIVEQLIDARPHALAALAGLVFDAAGNGDEVATAILRDGAAYLSALARRLGDDGPVPLSLLGGLSDVLLPWLDADIANRLSPPQSGADIGALFFARREYARETGSDR